jgi:hypothetical protein
MPRGKIFASSTRQSGTVELIILIVLCFLLFRILASQEQSPGPGPRSPLGVPTPTETPIPPPGDASFDCQPGIEVGKTINVVYHAVRGGRHRRPEDKRRSVLVAGDARGLARLERRPQPSRPSPAVGRPITMIIEERQN